MDITRILNTKRVLLDMHATNKAEAIEELTDLLQKRRGDKLSRNLYSGCLAA